MKNYKIRVTANKKQVRGTNKMRMTIHEYIWVSLVLLGSSWVSLGVFVSFRVSLGFFGSPLISVGLLGTPSLLTQESLWVSFGLFGIFGSP